jgi:hypothetical protein
LRDHDEQYSYFQDNSFPVNENEMI